MSHFTVVVITSTPEEVGQVLAPYDENLDVPHTEYIEPDELERATKMYTENPQFGVDPTDSLAVLRGWLEDEVKAEDGPDGTVLYSHQSTLNPNRKWDWYQIGGRWKGFFQLKEGEQAPEVELDRWDLQDGQRPDQFVGRTDQARKHQIDFQAMRGEAIVKAHADYDKFEVATRGLDVPRSWSAILDLYGPDEVDLARKVYAEQPFIKALRAARLEPSSAESLDYWYVTSGGRAAYVEAKADESGIPFAMVADGVWREHGHMGWFAIVSDEMDRDDWNGLVRRIYEQLPDDTLLTCVDCHI